MSTEPELEPEAERAEWARFDAYWGWICRECEGCEGWAKLDGRAHGRGCSKQPIVFRRAE